jgi:HK97 family phage major capsid protein
MWARLHARSRPNSAFFINQDCEPALDDLAKIIGTAGIEPNYVTYGPDGVLRIKGRPVVPVEYASTVGTVGDIVLADLTQYAFITTAIQQAASIHFKFDTDEQSFRATIRIDGALRWKEALTPFKGTNTQSPVITLATRA